ncbi:MAG TPA: DNA-binding protein YbiB [Usitatibacter sp.]|jgi:anthranilate phosphoribosyltransferase|nr:DNA-binding protein YbiB [Usitatibacter sp.]
MNAFDARPYLKEIARGKHGARDLTREQARTLFTAIFTGDVAEVALGAILVALRVKNETPEELAGMMEALARFVQPVRFPVRRALPLLVPTYNGARKLPNLVPLLALLVAREGVPVLLHGTMHEPQRVGTFEILDRIGYPAAESVEEAEQALESRSLAAVPTAVLSPALARILELRHVTGVRNSAHTLAKLLLPAGVARDAAFRLVAVTHPDFRELMGRHFESAPGHALLLRGVEGEPVVRLRAPQPIEEIDARGVVTHVIDQHDEEPVLPARDAESTARWTEAVLAGRERAPAALAAQAALIAKACRDAGADRPPLKLVSAQ